MRLRGLKEGTPVLLDGEDGYQFVTVGDPAVAIIRKPAGYDVRVAARRISRLAPAKKEPALRFKKGDVVDCDGSNLDGLDNQMTCVGGVVRKTKYNDEISTYHVRGAWKDCVGNLTSVDSLWVGQHQIRPHVPAAAPTCATCGQALPVKSLQQRVADAINAWLDEDDTSGLPIAEKVIAMVREEKP